MKVPRPAHALIGSAIALESSVAAWLPWREGGLSPDVPWGQAIGVAIALLVIAVLTVYLDSRKHSDALRGRLRIEPVTVAAVFVIIGACTWFLAPRYDLVTVLVAVLLACTTQVTVAVLADKDFVPLIVLVALVGTAGLLWAPTSWGLLVGVAAIGVAVIVILAASGLTRGRSGVLLGIGSIGIVASLVAMALPAQSSVRILAAPRPIDTNVEVLYDGRNYPGTTPVLTGATVIARSGAGTTAVFQRYGQASYGIWRFDGPRVEMLWTSTGGAAPSGRALVETADDADYAQKIARLLDAREDVAEIMSTTDMAFDGDVLYGVTSTDLWRLDGTDVPRSVHHWDEERFRQLSVVAAGSAAVVSTDDKGHSVLELIELASGDVSEPIRIVGAEDEDRQDIARRENQAGYVGPAALKDGRFLVLVGTEVHEVGPDRTTSLITTINFGSSTTPVRRMAASEDLLILNGSSTYAGRNYRETVDWLPLFATDDEMTCGAQMKRAALRSEGVLDVEFSSDGSVLEVLQLPTSNCGSVRWTANVDTEIEWEPMSRAQSTSPRRDINERRAIGATAYPTTQGPSMLAPYGNTLVSLSTNGGSITETPPSREVISDSIRAFDVERDTYWYAGLFTAGLPKDVDQGQWALLSVKNDQPTIHSEVGLIRDIDALPSGEVLVARCEALEVFDAATATFHRVAGRDSTLTDCGGKPDFGNEENWPSIIGIPHAVAGVSAGDDDVVYVAEVKTNPDASRARFGVSVVNRSTGAVAPLSGGDVTHLRAVPVDIDVSDIGNVCLATAHADRPGPLVVVIGGRPRVVETHGRLATGCAWENERLLISTDQGEFIALSSADFTEPSTVIVP